jgi:hypothetical protein
MIYLLTTPVKYQKAKTFYMLALPTDIPDFYGHLQKETCIAHNIFCQYSCKSQLTYDSGKVYYNQPRLAIQLKELAPNTYKKCRKSQIKRQNASETNQITECAIQNINLKMRT